MLVEWIVRDKWVKYLTKILREFDWEGNQKTDGLSTYKQMLMNAKLKTGQRSHKNRADWEKSIKKGKSVLDLSFTEEEEDKEEEEEEEEEE